MAEILDILLDSGAMTAAANTIKPAESFLMDKVFKKPEVNYDENINLVTTQGNIRIAQLVHAGEQEPKTVDILEQEGQNIKIPGTWEEKVFTMLMLKKFEALQRLYLGDTTKMDNAIMDRVSEEVLDLKNRVIRLLEVMGGSLLSTGKILVSQKGFDLSIDFNFVNLKQKETLAAGNVWSSTTAPIPTELSEWKKKAKGANMLILGDTAAANFLANTVVQADANRLHWNAGNIDLNQPASEAAIFLGNMYGLDIWNYHQKYEDKNGAEQPVVALKSAIMLNTNKRFPLQIAPVDIIGDDMKLSHQYARYYIATILSKNRKSVAWTMEQKSIPSIYDMDAVYTVTTSA
jgi:hypothetical protein